MLEFMYGAPAEASAGEVCYKETRWLEELAKKPHTHHTTPPATRAASAGQHGTHRGRNRYHPSTHTTKDGAPGQLPGAQKHVRTLKRWRVRPGQA